MRLHSIYERRCIGMAPAADERDVDALAAEQLGMSQNDLMWLKMELSMLRGRAEATLKSPLQVYPDGDNEPWWEVRVDGALRGIDGLVIEFDFRLVIHNTSVLWGSSHIADRYKITTPDGRGLFEGELESPDESEDDDPAGWAAYDVFGPVRSVAVETMTALLATGRLGIEKILE
jgi:hypothetical protein